MNIEKKYDFKKESDMYGWFKKLFDSLGFFYYKISDSSMGYKPYDAIMHNSDWTYHIEYKFLKKTSEDVYKSLRPQQKYALDQITRLWWKAVVVVYYADVNMLTVYDYWAWAFRRPLSYLTQRQDSILSL